MKKLFASFVLVIALFTSSSTFAQFEKGGNVEDNLAVFINILLWHFNALNMSVYQYIGRAIVVDNPLI